MASRRRSVGSDTWSDLDLIGLSEDRLRHFRIFVVLTVCIPDGVAEMRLELVMEGAGVVPVQRDEEPDDR